MFVHGWSPWHGGSFEHIIEPISLLRFVHETYLLASPSSLLTLCYQARCSE